MTNRHYKRWLLQMPVGFLFTAGGILIIMYAASKGSSDEWLMWGIASAMTLNLGLGLLGNAYVHKVKSDLIRKERARHEHPDEMASN